jgi:hypothetical protein
MRLHSLTDAIAVDDPVYGHFEPDPVHGGFDLPDELAERLHRFHVRKRRAWETEIERDERTHGEEHDRRRDPETLYNAVAEIANATKNLAGGQAQPVPADILAEIAALRAELAELRATAHPAPADGGGNGDDDNDGGGDNDDTETPPEVKPKRGRAVRSSSPE